MCLQSSSRAQSAAALPSLRPNTEIPSSLIATRPSASGLGGYRSAPLQKFICNKGYTQKDCNDEMVVLRKALANYHASDVGEWTWVLVRSEDWKLILLGRGLDPGVPALTLPGARTTFFEEALVAGPIGRVSELMEVWHLGRPSLLGLAIRHELGHALCNDVNERTAERVAKLLEEGKRASCTTTAGPKSMHQ